MSDLIDKVGVILSRVEASVEVSAQNISNAATSGYKRGIRFEGAAPDMQGSNSIGNSDLTANRLGGVFVIDATQGQLQTTGNPDDLAIMGDGFFSVRATDGASFYTRQGQFRRDADGHLVTSQGCILQQRGGGDLVLNPGDFKVLGDGTVLQSGEAVGRIGVVTTSQPEVVAYADDGLYSAPDDTVADMDAPSLSQGAVEASNVALGSEMMTIMAALREAQSGQRLMGVYDDLMARAVATFGQDQA